MVSTSLAPALVAILGFELFAEALSEEDKPEVTVDQVLTAWNRPKERVKSGKFVWTDKQVIPKGTYDVGAGPPTTFQEDKIRVFRSTLTFRGNGWRYETEITEETGKPLFRSRVNVFDGRVFKSYIVLAGDDAPQGTIKESRQHEDVTSAQVAPFLWAFQAPGSEMVGPKTSSARLSASLALLGNKKCVVLEQPIGGSLESYWHDPDQGFAIVRYVFSSEGRASTQIDVTYSHDRQEHVWVPSKWKIVRLDGTGNILGQLQEYELNKDFPESTFQIDFPGGTRVFEFGAEGLRDYVQPEEKQKWLPWVIGSAILGLGLFVLSWIIVRRRLSKKLT